jgi:hypothetical protein
MKRKAILIGSPGSPYLAGVEIDLINMKNYLSSAIGGSWNVDTELVECSLNPSYAQLEPHLNSLQYCDYALVYYSGHGFTNSNNEGQINLNENEIIAVKNLANRCNKQITIVDACRGYSKYFNAIDSIKPSPFVFENSNAEYAKNLFEKFISHCPNGRVLLYATQLGQNATDTNNGGYFSTHLLTAAKQVTQTTKKPIIKIVDVFNEAHTILNEQNKPDIECTNNVALNLPFAVNPIMNTPQPVTTLRDIAGITFGAIAVVGTTVLIAEILTGGNKK